MNWVIGSKTETRRTGTLDLEEDPPERLDFPSEEGELPGLDTPSPLELLDLLSFFFQKFFIVALICTVMERCRTVNNLMAHRNPKIEFSRQGRVGPLCGGAFVFLQLACCKIDNSI